MTEQRRRCPECRTALDKVRWLESGSEYGCGSCGKWFTPDQLTQPVESLGIPGLSRMNVVLGLRATTLAGSVRELIPKALHGTGKAFLKSAEIAKSLGEGISEGSDVEFHQGMAFIHSRVEELHEARWALGVSADGLSHQGAAPARVSVVVLFLWPSRSNGCGVPHWARKKFCDERTIYRLRKAQDLAAVFQALRSE